MDRTSSAFGMSFAITAVLSSLLVVIKELNEGVLGWMAALAGHHWVAHGLLQLISFILIGIVLLRTDPAPAGTIAAWVAGGTIVGTSIIGVFFLVH